MTVYEDMVAMAHTAAMRRELGIEQRNAVTLRDADFEEMLAVARGYSVPLTPLSEPITTMWFAGLEILRERNDRAEAHKEEA